MSDPREDALLNSLLDHIDWMEGGAWHEEHKARALLREYVARKQAEKVEACIKYVESCGKQAYGPGMVLHMHRELLAPIKAAIEARGEG